MARIKCPSNVSSITLATSGILSPDAAGIITCTALEANALHASGFSGINGANYGCANLVSTSANGDITIAVPVVITSITINSIAYTVTGAVTPFGRCLNAAVPAPAGSQFLYQNFLLVNG